jgi:hypothetical protein
MGMRIHQVAVKCQAVFYAADYRDVPFEKLLPDEHIGGMYLGNDAGREKKTYVR